MKQISAEAEKTAFYMTFRSSGIAYGPRWASQNRNVFCFCQLDRYRAVDVAMGRTTPAKGGEMTSLS